MENTGIPVIVILTYLAGEIYKGIFKKKEAKKYIPLISAVLGGILGTIIYFTSKETILNVTNIWDAIVIGIVSGESATGTNQIIKQIFKKEEGENDGESTT